MFTVLYQNIYDIMGTKTDAGKDELKDACISPIKRSQSDN